MINILIDGLDDIQKECDEAIGKFTELTLQTLERIGETYATTAKERGSYNNVTGNLRNSNGYIVREKNKEIISPLSPVPDIFTNEPQESDIELVAGAVMDYASAVQRKGYDVTDSGQIAAESLARQLL